MGGLPFLRGLLRLPRWILRAVIIDHAVFGSSKPDTAGTLELDRTLLGVKPLPIFCATGLSLS